MSRTSLARRQGGATFALVAGALGCALAWGACTIYNDTLLEPAGTGGAGATGSGGSGGIGATGGGGNTQSGGGGAAAQCNAPGDCPDVSTTCHTVTCLNNSCGATNAGTTTTCNENNGHVCDGNGSCVECNTTPDCGGTDVCTNHTCGPTPCNNTVKDPTETDVDCGGVCVNGNLGKCGQGDHCLIGNDCSTVACADTYCCAATCAGPCEQCDLAGSEGTCQPIPVGTDPDNECAGADMCNGAGQCRCLDNQPNGLETATDCGGGVCPPCADGLTCSLPSDCQSGVCATTCQVPNCTDTVMNGAEKGVDCGGGCPNGCPNGTPCSVNADCSSGECAGTCQAVICGDGTAAGAEECDDGNTLPGDGCNASCALEPPGLLLTEVKFTPTGAEFIEIHNPTAAPIVLTNYYLADYNGYYGIAQGQNAPNSTDFRIRFPAGTQIAAGAYLVVSLETATTFNTAFGFFPDFDLSAADANAPDMLGEFGASAGLTDASEMVMLFYWDGASARVSDVDYVAWGTDTTVRVDKTGVVAGGEPYANDTAAASQVATGGTSFSIHRCDLAETTETLTGGNGPTGHNETSESGTAAWKVTSSARPPSPKAAAPVGLCP